MTLNHGKPHSEKFTDLNIQKHEFNVMYFWLLNHQGSTMFDIEVLSMSYSGEYNNDDGDNCCCGMLFNL